MPEERSFRCGKLKSVLIGEQRRRAGVRIIGLEVYDEATVLRWDAEGESLFALGLRDSLGRVYVDCVASRENDVIHSGRIRGRTVFAPAPDRDAGDLFATVGSASIPLSVGTELQPSRPGASFAILPTVTRRVLGLAPTIAEIGRDSVCVHWHFLPPLSPGAALEPPTLELALWRNGALREEQKAWLRTDEALFGSSQFLVPPDQVASPGAHLAVGGHDPVPLW